MDWKRSFPELTEQDLALILPTSEKQEFFLGDTIIDEGDQLDHFFVLESGKVGVERSLHGGVFAQFINPLEPGDIFGEMSFISPIHASATLIALTDVRTITFKFDAVREAAAENDGFAARLYHSMGIVLVDRLVRTNQRTDTFDPRI
jgi:CRP-like cAMP-binding protein